jgi:hypothetical protein
MASSSPLLIHCRRALAKTYIRSVFPTGSAIRTLLDRAVGEVELLTLNSCDTASQRIAWFLYLWYKEGRTVTMAAEVLDLSRSYVAQAVQPRALELVAKHFPGVAAAHPLLAATTAVSASRGCLVATPRYCNAPSGST